LHLLGKQTNLIYGTGKQMLSFIHILSVFCTKNINLQLHMSNTFSVLYEKCQPTAAHV